MSSPAPPLLEYASPDGARPWNGRAFASLALGMIAMPAAVVIARAVGLSTVGEWITVALLCAAAVLAIALGAGASRYPDQRGTNLGYAGAALGGFWLTMAILHAALGLFGR